MIEQIADAQHAIWAHWMKYLFEVSIQNEDGSVTIPADKVSRWQRQMATDYKDLTESEKKSDRHQAIKVIASMGLSKDVLIAFAELERAGFIGSAKIARDLISSQEIIDISSTESK